MFEGFTRAEIDTSGARINLRHGGDGPPLLLLHGNPLTHASWSKIAPDLAKHFHVVAADLRGYGDSVGPDDGGENNLNYSFRAMAQDQVEVMEKLGYREFFVAGHDRGARTTARMCLDHSDRVKRAALIDILPKSSHLDPHLQRMGVALMALVFDGSALRFARADAGRHPGAIFYGEEIVKARDRARLF